MRKFILSISHQKLTTKEVRALTVKQSGLPLVSGNKGESYPQLRSKGFNYTWATLKQSSSLGAEFFSWVLAPSLSGAAPFFSLCQEFYSQIFFRSSKNNTLDSQSNVCNLPHTQKLPSVIGCSFWVMVLHLELRLVPELSNSQTLTTKNVIFLHFR